LACAGFVLAERAVWFEGDSNLISRRVYGPNPFPEAEMVADYIRENTGPNEPIGVIGSEPEICFYARRKSASGYIYMYDLVQPHQYASAMQREAMDQITAAKPLFLVLVNVPQSWVAFANSDQTFFDWANGYSVADYNVEGLIKIFPDHTDVEWGQGQPRQEIGTQNFILVLRRKSGI